MRYCGRDFTPTEIDLIRELLTTPQINRARLSREVCERLGWRRDNGGLKDMSCRVALLRMQADGLITLAAAAKSQTRRLPVLSAHRTGGSRARPRIPSIDLATLSVDPVLTKADSLLWNAYIERHHYLGHQLMPGAQLRYFVRAAGHIVAALGFGASAWKVKPRDQLIGWTSDQRQRNLHLVVNNARFLILPWIHCKNLASRILALVSRRLPDDWHARYAYRPGLARNLRREAALYRHLLQGRQLADTSAIRRAGASSTPCIATHNPSRASGSIRSCATSSGSSATGRSHRPTA